MTLSFSRCFFLLFAGVSLLSLRAAPDPNAGPVVELPKFVVTDSRDLPPPEAWRYAELPGFEVLTNAPDSATKRLLNDFDLFRRALDLAFPIPRRSAAPTALILCGRGGKFDLFAPNEKLAAGAARASLFLSAPGRTAIVLDLQSSVIDLSDSPSDDTTRSQTSFAVDHHKQLYREYVHFLLSQNPPRPPAWLEEGLAQIVMAMQFDKDSITFGQLEDPNLVSTGKGLAQATSGLNAAGADELMEFPTAPVEDRDFNAALKEKALMPLPKLFGVSHDSPEARSSLGNNGWSKQCYAFVHYCLYGEGGKHQKEFAQFVARTAREPLSEALFKECFKVGYTDMLRNIRSYCETPVYQYRQFKLTGNQLATTDVPLRDATQAEIGRIKGETLALAGHADRARMALIAPYTRGEADPRLLAALGLFERASGEDQRARKFLEAAATGKVTRPDALLELARLRYAAALAAPAGKDNHLSAAQTTDVIAPLLIARQQPPSLIGIYELAADAWVHSEAKPTRNDVGVLIAGIRELPGHIRLVGQTATLCVESGYNDAAGTLIDYGLQLATDDATKQKFLQLRSAIASAPAAK